MNEKNKLKFQKYMEKIPYIENIDSGKKSQGNRTMEMWLTVFSLFKAIRTVKEKIMLLLPFHSMSLLARIF